MYIYTCFLTVLYIALTATFLIAWIRIPLRHPLSKNTSSFLKITVIIPIRNEANNILDLLNDMVSQDYPKDQFEVIVVNDHSTDDTAQVVSTFIAATKYPISLINLSLTNPVISYKKKAIATGIEASKGTFIVTTDGDCRVGPSWLSSINDALIENNAFCLCGPVMFTQERAFFSQLQILEFAALSGSGAACISLGLPGMCNGANFIYKKEIFYEVNGFENIDEVASGDDELLMHKILANFPGKVFFLKNKSAIVTTLSNQSLRQFYQQRKRWAGKWSYHKGFFVKGLALFIFIFNLYLVLGWIFIFSGGLDWRIFLVQYILKAVIEYSFISKILTFFERKPVFFHFVFLQIVYPFYITFFGIVANFGGYEWKERKVN